MFYWWYFQSLRHNLHFSTATAACMTAYHYHRGMDHEKVAERRQSFVRAYMTHPSNRLTIS